MPLIRIDVRNLETDDALREAIAEGIEGDPEFLAALVDVKRHDSQAVYLDDTFTIDAVDHLPNDQVEVVFRYGWDAFSPCKDLRKTDLNIDGIVGDVENGLLTLQTADLPEPRYPCDEL